MYEQYCLMKYTDEEIDAFKEEDNMADAYSFYWLRLESTAFYLYVGAAIVFLFYIQMRGILGYDDEAKKTDRFKYDCLQYYEQDIHWFSFTFFLLGVHLRSSYSAYDQFNYDNTLEETGNSDETIEGLEEHKTSL